MAQRTGTDGFIASAAKTASARGILALAVALALLLSGCGGDSDSETESDAVSAPRLTAESQTGQGKKSAPASQQAGATTAKEGAKARGADGAQGTQATGSVKQGKRISIPGDSPEPAATPAERAQATIADITLESPDLGSAVAGESALPADYTCDGANRWPALRWEGVPAGSAELMLFAMNVQPVKGRLFFDWAVAGIDPSTQGIQAGRLPSGAVVGRNSFGKSGYSICPKGSGETYIFALYALPERIPTQKGFDPRALREEVLEISGNVGLLGVTYARG